MKASLAGWRRVVVEGGVLLLPPDPNLGLIRVRAREPLRPVRAIIDGYARAGLAGGPGQLRAPPRALHTDEGEHAVLAGLAGRAQGRTVHRDLGIVIGDEHVAIVDGRAGDEAEFETFAQLVERLTRSFCMGLGTERWRRFYYTPPAGWHGVERHRADVWLAPDFPRQRAIISIFHARPERPSTAALQHARLFESLTSEYRLVGPSQANPIRVRSGLIGEAVLFEAEIDGVAMHASNVGFSDGRYLYLVRLETPADERDAHTGAFREVVDSVEPVPWPRHDLGALVHWSE